MPGMFDRDKLASEMTHEARDDSRVTFEDVIYSLLGTTAEEAGRNREEWNRLVSNPSEIVNQLSNWPDPRAFTARESDASRTNDIISNVIPGGGAGTFVGVKGIKNLGKYDEYIRAWKLRQRLEDSLKDISPEGRANRLWGMLRPFWFDAPDYSPRMEIPDYKMRVHPENLKRMHLGGGSEYTLPHGVVPSIMSGNYYRGMLSDVIDHPELYKAYPDLRNVEIDVVPSVNMGGKKWGGYWQADPPPGKIVTTTFPEDAISASTLAHEWTHAIQGKEWHAKGGYGLDYASPKRKEQIKQIRADVDAAAAKLYEREKEILRTLNEPLRGPVSVQRYERDVALRKELEEIRDTRNEHFWRADKDTEMALYDAYMENAGEAEARAVEKRLTRDLAYADLWGASELPPESAFELSIPDLFVIR